MHARRLALLVTTALFLGHSLAFAVDKNLPVLRSKPRKCDLAVQKNPGHQALREAPDDVKEKIRVNWKSMLRTFTSGWTARATELLMAVDEDHTDLRGFVQQAIHEYLARAPKRQTENLLTGPQLQMPKNLPARESIAGSGRFADKYELHRFMEVNRRIFEEVLPPEYMSEGVYSADFDRNFSSLSLIEAFYAAHMLDLHQEMGILLQRMIIHEKFENLAVALEMLGNDKAMFTSGLYILGKFYGDLRSPYYCNKVWDAIELLKRMRTPAMRAQFRELMIDLAEDIMSPDFFNDMSERFGGDSKEAKSSMGAILANVLRGLRSSGDVLYAKNEDSIKVDVVTRSNDPKLRAMIRKLVVYAEKNGYNLRDQVEALAASGDKEWLLARAEKYLQEDKPEEALSYIAAAGDFRRAAEHFLQSPSGAYVRTSYGFRSLLDTLQRAGVESQFRAELAQLTHDPQFKALVDELAKENARGQHSLEQRGLHTSSVEWDFRMFLSILNDHPSLTISQMEASAQRLDNLNAGGQYARIAYAHYLQRLNDKLPPPTATKKIKSKPEP